MRQPAATMWGITTLLWRWAAIALVFSITFVRRDLSVVPFLLLAIYTAIVTLVLPRAAVWDRPRLLGVLDIVASSLCVVAGGGQKSPVYIVYLTTVLDVGTRLPLVRVVLLATAGALAYAVAAWVATPDTEVFDPSLMVMRGFLFLVAAVSSSSLTHAYNLQRQRAVEAHALSSMMRLAAAAALDMQALVQAIAEQSCAGLQADAAVVRVTAVADNEELPLGAYGLEQRQVDAARGQMDDHLCQTARQSRRAIAVALRPTDVRSGMAALLPDAVAIACAPLVLDSDVLGCLWIARRRGPPFAAPEIELLELMAQHAALVVRNAGLHSLELRTVAQLKAAEETKSEFLSMISHELRTPLTSIRAAAGLLLDAQTGSLTPGQQRLVHSIARNADRLTNLVTDLLDMARLQTGHLTLTCELTDVHPIVRACVSGLRPLIEQKGQKLTVSVPTELPRVIADRKRVEQVITNLLSNAHYYTPQGGNINLSVGAIDGELRFTVSDDGPGIPVEERELVFQRFYRGVGARQMHSGAGLGLSVAKSLVELHGGTIRYRPGVKGGSEFSFTLPLEGPQETGE